MRNWCRSGQPELRWPPWSAVRLTRTCTRAGSTNGTPPRRSRWRGPPGATRRASTGRRWPTTRRTCGCQISWSVGPRSRARSCKRSGKSRMRPDYQLSQLDVLEAEAVHVMREVAAEFERPVLLFSGGKDSIVMLALAEKAFWPARIPFPVMHVDTGHNFPEVLEFRDRRVAELEAQLVVASVQESIDTGRVAEEPGLHPSRNRLQTRTLLDAIVANRYDAVFGGARRDEEKARAKERGYSFRDEFGQWDPKNQRPELWGLYNGRHHPGEHIRVFPLSDWTELDIWQYIAQEQIEIPSIYFAHRREVFRRDGMLLSVNPFVERLDHEEIFET